MTGKELYELYRTNMRDAKIHTKPWNQIGALRRAVWDNLAHEITAGHKFILASQGKVQ